MKEPSDFLSEIGHCAKCGKCRSVCPVFREAGDERLVARGRIALLEAFLKGEIKDSGKFKQAMEQCLLCMRCAENCPSGVEAGPLIAYGREKAVNTGLNKLVSRVFFRFVLQFRRVYDTFIWVLSLAQQVMAYFDIIPKDIQRHLPLWAFQFRGVPKMARKSALHGLPRQKTFPDARLKVTIFTGCLSNYVYDDMIADLCEVLEHLHISYRIPREQLCCGAPCLFYGDPKSAYLLAKKNIAALRMDDSDAVLTPCASCARMIKTDYAGLIGRFGSGSVAAYRPEKVMDIMEFMEKNIDLDILLTKHMMEDGMLDPERKLKLRWEGSVTYHRPCHQVWEGADAANRAAIARMADYAVSPDGEVCCGGGGLFAFKFAEMSSSVAGRKVESIVASKTPTVATACPGCVMQLRKELGKRGSDVRVVHPVHILAELLRKGKNSCVK